MDGSGIIRAGTGGWIFEPWEGSFYPPDLAKKRQLEFASRKLRTVEVNATYYRGQSPDTFARWAQETPDNFVFALKGNRFVTNRKVLADAASSMDKFFEQGIEELGPKLGPIVWQFANSKKFEPEDFAGFLKLLPREHAGLRLRHALEVRHDTFRDPEFVRLAGEHGCAICYAHHAEYPEFADITADFVYARLQRGDDANAFCYAEKELAGWSARMRKWAAGRQPDDLPLADPARKAPVSARDVFVYFITEGKARAPFGAMELQRLVA